MELQMPHQIHCRMIQKKLQMNMIKNTYIYMTMEPQKLINFSDNKPNQPFKSKTKNQVEVNDESQGKHNEDNEIRFKTSMVRSSLCDYNDAYILVKGSIIVGNTAA